MQFLKDLGSILKNSSRIAAHSVHRTAVRLEEINEQSRPQIVRSPTPCQHESLHQVEEALAFGLTKEQIHYLGVPIKAIAYLVKYRVSKDELAAALSRKKIKGAFCGDILWVEDKKFTK
ncbi:hypothetical protein [Xenophilus sp. Marseille-Q4582]|uniref:hypothetical protein n=1 Tax=Xenophilus sp. Marseille-Q4582 TaxID=2866600 RepID=UPI001CE44F0D|nr:hypothetical protein [Xenophilus sp. Marseille-Q4582]